MTRLLQLLAIVLVFGFAACADEMPFSSRLVTAETILPDDVTDSRGDGVLRDATGRPATSDLLGQPFPKFSARKIDDSQFDTEALEGRWTVLAIWGVWCHDSRNDMENISSIAMKAAELDDLEFLSVHVPQSASRLDSMYRNYGSVAGFFEERGVSFPVILDETGDIRELLSVKWTPTYLLISPDLTVQGFRTDISKGGMDALQVFWDDIEQLRSDL